MLYVGNAFSLSMISSLSATLQVKNLTLEEAQMLVASNEFVSAVGHADTAAVYSNELGTVVSMNRIKVALSSDDQVLVGQLVGPRLPEGATTLPDNIQIQWILVTL